MNSADHFQGLPEKDFDQIFDETKKDHPDAETDEISVLANAKMQIRQSYINERQQRDEDRQEAMKIPITDELYRGWKAFQIQQGHLSHNERNDFDETIQYLLQRRPEKLIFIHPFWMEAITDPIAAFARFEDEMKKTHERFEEMWKKSMEGEMGRQLNRFVEVMSKRQDGKTREE